MIKKINTVEVSDIGNNLERLKSYLKEIKR